MNKNWVDVDKEMPSSGMSNFSARVLVAYDQNGHGFVSCDRFDFDNNYWLRNNHVTHWQPLPDLPD